MKFEFSRQIFKQILKYRLSWKYDQLEQSNSMWADTQTDLKLIVAFRSFAIGLKKNNIGKSVVKQYSLG